MVLGVNRICLALGVLALISACKARPVPAVSEVTVAAQQPPEDDPWTLTMPMLDGYLRYQRALLVQAGKLKPPEWDGGLKQFVEPSIEQKASLDERARQEANLTADDVVNIEAMVSRVAGRRMTGRLIGMDQPMPELPAGDPKEQGPDVPKALADHEKMRKTASELLEERAAFGNRAIDLLLAREDELLKNWSLMMEVPELGRH